MLLHYEVDTHQNTPVLQANTLDGCQGDELTNLASAESEPPRFTYVDRSRYLRNGARVLSFDERSNSALCTLDGEWSVWLLDEDGARIRGSYFESLSAAAFDYAERVMGYNSGDGDEDVSDLDD